MNMRIPLASIFLVSIAALAGCATQVDPDRIGQARHGVVPPPPECSDGLVTRTQGFWQNHSCVVKGDATGYALVPQALGASLVLDKPAEVEAYFDTPTQGDKQIILGHQLLAAKLNRAAFGIGSIEFADWDADGDLETVDELIALGDILFDNGTSADRVKMATILDKLNNEGDNEPLWFDPNCNSPPETCE
jgi:hypothetical protein